MATIDIENPHQQIDLEFKMEGPVFDNGLPLPLTIKSLENLQGILDRSYLVLAHKQRMSAQERSFFYLQSQGIQHGSLLTTLGLVFTAAQPVLPIISNLGPTGVWEHAKEAFEFIKIVFKAKKDGQSVTITNNGDGSLVNVNTGTQTVAFNQPIFNIAVNSLPHYEFFARHLGQEKVRNITLGPAGRRDIALTTDDKGLFDLPTRIDPQQHVLDCEIFEFDKYEGKGRLSVFDEQAVKGGAYRFMVMGRQDLSEYIEAMLRKHVKVTCMEEIEDHPILGQKTAALQVVNVKN